VVDSPSRIPETRCYTSVFMDSDALGLRKWREAKGITLDAIALSTKLSIRQLKAIESGDFRQLPGGVYNTSYIRQYALAIAFDVAQLLGYYDDFCRANSKDSRQGTRRSLSGPLLQN
jgi:cytoskeletal protein RodZ